MQLEREYCTRLDPASQVCHQNVVTEKICLYHTLKTVVPIIQDDMIIEIL